MQIDIAKITQIISQKLVTWFHDLVRLLPNIVVAAIVLVLGFFIAKFIRRLAHKFVSKVAPSPTISNLLSSIIYFTVLGIVFFTVLSILSLDKAVTSILAGAGILGLAIAFAFQDIAANFISGIFISLRKPLQVGDIVQIKDYMGKIQEINLRDTVMSTFQGKTVIIPNKEVFQNPIENYSLLQKRRFDLEVGVSYGEDLDHVKEVTLNAVKDIPGVSKEWETTLFYTSFGDSSINFSLRIWIDTAEQAVFKNVGSEAIMRIKKAYDQNGIMIPFPIRTLDFGIKGGQNLSEVLQQNSTKSSENQPQ